MHYKLRAECEDDVINLRQLLDQEAASLTNEKISNTVLSCGIQIPDVVYSFDVNLSLGEIKDIIRTIDDGHVMYETIELFENYTGERK